MSRKKKNRRNRKCLSLESKLNLITAVINLIIAIIYIIAIVKSRKK